ncbi:putative adhesin [Pelatocladus sp. BLCC-F211]|uniref:putative adhesin n=1 Tax=Pelatocladus sp. BLCC-F211 TaxID=3342752 RepID=UPI0035BB8CDB
MPDIIISAHGGRWSDDKQDFPLPDGSKVLYYVDDGGILSNSDGYKILGNLQKGNVPGGKVVQEVSSKSLTYDYSCWYAEEFKDDCGIYEVGSNKLIENLSSYTEKKPLLLSEICKKYPQCNIYWVCCREITKREQSDFLRNSPGAFLNAIQWTDDKGGAQVFPEIQNKSKFTVDVATSDQVSQWNKVLGYKEDFTEDGDKEVTLAIIQAAVMIITLLTLASLVAYALSRGYKITAKKTKTTMQFEFQPKEKVSYRVSGIYTSSSLNDEDDLSLDARLIDKDGNELGTLQIVREI